MRRSLSLFPMLLLAFLFAAPLAAQGPPAGVPGGGLTAALEALADRVDTLEDRADVLTAENAAQAAQIAAIELLLAQTDRSIPTGTVMPFAGPASAVPDGWLLCDGTEVDRAADSALFAVIGTAHGEGDGFTTFRLPDYRGAFLRGVDHGRGLDPDRNTRGNFTGGATGDQVGSLQGSRFAAHTHSLGSFGLCDSGPHNGGVTPVFNLFAGCLLRHSTGVNGGSETRPWNVYVNFIIKR
ncbi:MAG TPA: phage tail protein [Thermoanaerobaculia bacterium]|nr:phage tail protein [Thermoanaerobaculia bacterium]